MNEYRSNEDNEEHIGRHGVKPDEAKRVVDGAARGWPRKIGDGTLMVQGRGVGCRFVQVVFVSDSDGA